jgi:hypothetical protein
VDQQHPDGVTAITGSASIFITTGAAGSIIAWDFCGEMMGEINVPLRILNCCILNARRQILIGTKFAIMIIDGAFIFGDEIDLDDGLDNSDCLPDELLGPIETPSPPISPPQPPLQPIMCIQFPDDAEDSFSSDGAPVKRTPKLWKFKGHLFSPAQNLAPRDAEPLPPPAPPDPSAPPQKKPNLIEEMLGIPSEHKHSSFDTPEPSTYQLLSGDEEDIEEENTSSLHLNKPAVEAAILRMKVERKPTASWPVKRVVEPKKEPMVASPAVVEKKDTEKKSPRKKRKSAGQARAADDPTSRPPLPSPPPPSPSACEVEAAPPADPPQGKKPAKKRNHWRTGNRKGKVHLETEDEATGGCRRSHAGQSGDSPLGGASTEHSGHGKESVFAETPTDLSLTEADIASLKSSRRR